MTLTGLDPLDPTPSDRREIVLGVGPGPGAVPERAVVLVGNKTSAGSETLDVLDLTHPIVDDADAQARCGKRSELYWMYKKYVEIDPNATMYIGAITEGGGGTSAMVEWTIAGGASATANSSLKFYVLGTAYEVAITAGDLVNTIATNAVAALNAAENASLPIVATAPGAGVIHVHVSQIGVRHGSFLGGAGYGMRCSYTVPCGLTCAKSVITAGTVEDDATTFIASAANAEIYYHVLPWVTASPTTTDNQLGEYVAMLKSQASPTNGKEQIATFGFVGTQAQQTTACTAAALNTWQAHCYWAEASDWMPGMIAAHHTAIKRAAEVAHPSANVAGYAATATQTYSMPAPALVADRPTATEIKASLNNGGSPIGTTAKGTTYLVRDITTRCQTTTGEYDYKAREGHIYSAVAFFWNQVKATWAAQKQPFVDSDPAAGVMPKARTSTPAQLKAIAQAIISDFCSSKPMGIYDGPIFAPSMEQTMLSKVVTAKIPAGLTLSCEVYAVEHNLKSESKFSEVGASY